MKKRTGIQLCYPFEEKRLLKWNPPFLLQPKLDGERCRALLFPDAPPLMLSSTEETIPMLPRIFTALQELQKKLKLTKPLELELDGELYCHGLDFEEIHSRVSRTVNLHPQHEDIQFHVFDIVELETPQLKRIVKLQKLATSFFAPNGPLVHVPIDVAHTADDVRRIYDHYISLGYEGIIVRNFEAPYVRRRSTFVMKFKPKKKDIWPIVGFVEGQGKFKGTIGAIICRTDEETFEVGSFSMTDEKRAELWAKRFELSNYDCEIGYQHRWASGKPKSGVFYRLVERMKEPEFFNPLD